MRYMLVLVLAGVAGLVAVAWASDQGKGGFSAANYGGGGGSGTPVQLYPSGGGGLDRSAPEGGGGFDAPVVVGAAGAPARR
jgi:hypothetical protein